MKSERRKRPSRPAPSGPIRAAEYVRMSTEQPQYSTENQHAAIQRYADEHGLLIVRTFTDAGKSGVGIHGRDALKELLGIVNSGAVDFATVPPKLPFSISCLTRSPVAIASTARR